MGKVFEKSNQDISAEAEEAEEKEDEAAQDLMLYEYHEFENEAMLKNPDQSVSQITIQNGIILRHKEPKLMRKLSPTTKNNLGSNKRLSVRTVQDKKRITFNDHVTRLD